jgi:hypothetical protein
MGAEVFDFLFKMFKMRSKSAAPSFNPDRFRKPVRIKEAAATIPYPSSRSCSSGRFSSEKHDSQSKRHAVPNLCCLKANGKGYSSEQHLCNTAHSKQYPLSLALVNGSNNQSETISFTVVKKTE